MHLTTLLAIAAAFCLSSVSAGPSPCLTPGACKTAAKNTPANIKFIQFPESYNSEHINSTGLYHGFTYSWRRRCEGKCGDSGGHHFMSVVPTRAENIASASCWCCIKNPATGVCYDKTSPYSASSVAGPYTLMTDICIAKMTVPVKLVAESLVTSVPVPILTTKTKKPVAGQPIVLRWKGPKSGLIDAVFTAKFTVGKTTASVLLNKKTYDCVVPANIYGSAVAITVYSGKNQTPAFEVAAGTFKINKPAAVKRGHFDVLRRL